MSLYTRVCKAICKARLSRQTQAQHNHSVSKTAIVSLLDVLSHVPSLLGMLTPDSQKALSATCKSCRRQFIAQVQVVTVVRKEKAYVLLKDLRWPQLCMVISQDSRGSWLVSQPLNSTRIVGIHVSVEPYGQAAIFMLRPLHNLATDLPCPRLAAQQLAHQMRVRWPSMSFFSMSFLHGLDGLGLEIVSQLANGTWTQLKDLNLFGCELKAKAFLILSQGNWPSLEYLNVSNNCLDAEGLASLAKGNWPLLSAIVLSFDPTMDAVAIGHLCAATWPVTMLVIEDTPFSVDMAAELAGLQLPKLNSLFLSGLTAAAVSKLARADWPSLRYLSIGHDDINAVAVLLRLDLKILQALKSGSCDSLDMQRTGSGPDLGLWPNLKWIQISELSVQLRAWRVPFSDL